MDGGDTNDGFSEFSILLNLKLLLFVSIKLLI